MSESDLEEPMSVCSSRLSFMWALLVVVGKRLSNAGANHFIEGCGCDSAVAPTASESSDSDSDSDSDILYTGSGLALAGCARRWLIDQACGDGIQLRHNDSDGSSRYHTVYSA
jgi:hypothetical protein